MATKTNSAILNLDEIPEPVTLTFNEKDYPLKTIKDFSLKEAARLRKQVMGIQGALDATEELDEESAEFEAQLEIIEKTQDRLIRILVDAPDEIHKELTVRHKTAILSFFMEDAGQNSPYRQATESSDESSPVSTSTTTSPGETN